MDFDVTPGDERRFRAIDTIIDRLLRSTSKEELALVRCPVCGSPLDLAVHPAKRAFFLHCSASSVHLGKHVEADDLPRWMDEFISGGWYSQNA